MPDLHVYLHSPEIIFAARVNMPAGVTYPITSILFDGVTTGAYTDIVADMTLLLGTTVGADDLGRVRVQNVASAGVIPIGRTSEGYEDGELTIEDNAYITVWDDFRVWSKIPYIDEDGVQYKDTNVPVGTFTTNEPPVANCGPGFAGDIDSVTEVITVTFPPTGSSSFAVADAATISTYAWDVDDGTITVGTSASSSITATFPAGFRWVGLTVTDSNGVSHSARCPVYARDPANDTTLQVYTIERHHIEQGGQELTLRIYDDLPRSTYPDGMLMLFWDGEALAATDRSNIQMIGWHQSDDAETRATRTGNVQGTTLNFVDVAGRLKTLPGFPQELRRDATPNNWDEMVNPTMDKYIHYILQWHSTALSLADYSPSDTGDDYPFVVFGSTGESLFDQVQNEARALVPTHQFTCNRKGQLAVTVDPMLQDAADRTSDFQGTFTEAFTETLRFAHTRPPRVHWLRGHALLTATSYTVVDGVNTLPTVHCIAPGTAPGQGLNEVITSEGLAQSQAALNSAKGHEYARLNARYGPVVVDKADDANYNAVEPANLDWVNLQLSAENAAQRGFTFTLARAQCKALDFRYQATRTGMVRRSEFTLELETEGRPAITVIPEGTTTDPYVPDGPPNFGIITGQELVAAMASDGLLYTTADFQTISGSGGPTWTEIDLSITDTRIYSWVVDPFSPGYTNQDGTGAINGWVVGETSIWRVTDLFGTPAASIVHTFSTALTAASVFQHRTINASFGRYFATESDNPWLLVISHYADAAGHTGTWALYSVDAGQTWSSEVLISPHYDTDVSGDDPANVPMLYMSPRTPGLAYSAAYTETASPALADGYVTTDWGATWSRLSSDNNSEANPWPTLATMANETSLQVSPDTIETTIAVALVDSNVGFESESAQLLIAPHPDAVRVVVEGNWYATRTRSGAVGTPTVQVAMNLPAGVSQTGDFSYTQPDINGAASDTFTVEFTLDSGTDWPLNSESIISSPPSSPAGARFSVSGTVNSTNPDHILAFEANLTLRVTEIELDGGTIYNPGYTLGVIQPGHRLAGDIHIPWQGNSDELVMYYGALDRTTNFAYTLNRVESDGTTITDISPVVSARDFGVNGYGFAIRAYDSDRQKVVVAGRGNGASADTAGDYVAVFVSSNAGTTWAEIVAAANSTAEYRAAFAGDDSDVIYLWGPAQYFGYSTNFGSSIDSRAGNLAALSAVNFVGIAGGPIGG